MKLAYFSRKSVFGLRLAVPVAAAVLVDCLRDAAAAHLCGPGAAAAAGIRLSRTTARARNKPTAIATNVISGQFSRPASTRAAPDANAYERVVVQPANPPGSGTAAGAIGGAILGAIIGGTAQRGRGLLIGGATGAIVGSAADANAQAQAQQTQQRYNQSAATGRARADSYRRAIGACLQGRGYTVS